MCSDREIYWTRLLVVETVEYIKKKIKKITAKFPVGP